MRGPSRRSSGVRAWGRALRGVAGQAVDRGAHVPDVLGRRAAAAADDPRTGIQEAPHLLAEIRRRRGVDELAFDALRQAGVGDDGSRQAGRRPAHLDERIEADLRADTAVDTHGIDACRGQRSRGRLRTRAVDRDELLAERHLGDDRQVADSARASATPSSSSPRSLNVSNSSTSAPPSRRPSICSRNASRM